MMQVEWLHDYMKTRREFFDTDSRDLDIFHFFELKLFFFFLKGFDSDLWPVSTSISR